VKLLLMKRSGALDRDILVQTAYSQWNSTGRQDRKLIYGHLLSSSKNKVTITLMPRELFRLQCINGTWVEDTVT